MSETKLHIEVDGAVLDVEGDTKLVQQVYNDFKEQIAAAEGEAIAADHAKPAAPVVASAPIVSGAEARSSVVPPSVPARSDVAPIVALTHDPKFDAEAAVPDLVDADQVPAFPGATHTPDAGTQS